MNAGDLIPPHHPAAKLGLKNLHDVQGLGAATIRTLIAHWKKQRMFNALRKGRLLETLRNLHANADEKKPVLSSVRSEIHFELQADVAYVVATNDLPEWYPPQVITGVVCEVVGWPSPKVLICLTSALRDGRIMLWVERTDPHLLRAGELHYFRQNQEFLKLWLHASANRFVVVPRLFMAAISSA